MLRFWEILGLNIDSGNGYPESNLLCFSPDKRRVSTLNWATVASCRIHCNSPITLSSEAIWPEPLAGFKMNHNQKKNIINLTTRKKNILDLANKHHIFVDYLK
jgi:hypothetical protein